MPSLQFGTMTRQKIYVLDSPSVCALYMRLWSKPSNAPRTVRYMSGNVTIAVANIAEYHVIVRRTPNISSTGAPTGPSGPMVMSRKKPTTVGGSTMGSVRMQSRTPFENFGSFEI